MPQKTELAINLMDVERRIMEMAKFACHNCRYPRWRAVRLLLPLPMSASDPRLRR